MLHSLRYPGQKIASSGQTFIDDLGDHQPGAETRNAGEQDHQLRAGPGREQASQRQNDRQPEQDESRPQADRRRLFDTHGIADPGADPVFGHDRPPAVCAVTEHTGIAMPACLTGLDTYCGTPGGGGNDTTYDLHAVL